MRVSSKAALAIVAGACIVASAGSVHASVIFAEGNNPQPGQENIQFQAAHTGTVLTGFTNDTNTEVKFTGDGETLVAASSGAARIEAQDGFFDYLKFHLVGTSFDSLILTIDANDTIDPGNVTFFAVDQFNVTHQSLVFSLKPNGGNTFTITTDALQVMTSLWFTSTSEIAFVDVAQFRVAPVISSTPVPEPASMLLLGTGLAGLAAARRRRRP